MKRHRTFFKEHGSRYVLPTTALLVDGIPRISSTKKRKEKKKKMLTQ